MLAGIHSRLRAIQDAAARALPRAAARIESKLRADSTTGRGNVPAYGELGPATAARAEGDAVVVSAAGWVHDKARELDQPAEWADILAEEVRRAAGEDR